MVKIDDRACVCSRERRNRSLAILYEMGVCVYTFSLFCFSFLFILAGGREWPEGDAGEQYPML